MIPNLESVLHDSTSLYRFVDSLCSVCEISGEYPSYLESSLQYFRYIGALGDSTKKFLEDFARSLSPDNQITFNAERQKLATLRLAWFEIHQYIKPATDAHTLNIPSPLLASFLRRFKSIKGLEEKDFIILHTDQVNYFEAHALVRQHAANLKLIIPNAPDFPEQFGVIAIPYSQADSLFLNCSIAHEMGHFLFQGLSDERYEKLMRGIKGSLEITFGESYAKLAETDIFWCRDILLGWAEEIFCDFFAIWMVGPCFSLAYIELLDLTVSLYPSTTPSDVYLMTPRFSITHPARLFRLREHVRLLRNLKWWPEVERYKTNYIQLLQQAEQTPQQSFRFIVTPKAHLTSQTLQAFFSISKQVEELVGEIMDGVDSGLQGYQKYHKFIEDYFSNGVVPSTIVTPPSEVEPGSDTKVNYPDFIAILNTAYKFYLESFPNLIEKIQGANSSSCIDRNTWLKRLESWTLKAVEDSGLLAASQQRH